MPRKALLLAFSAVPLAGGAVSLRPVPLDNGGTAGCVNTIGHEPVLIYEVRGGTLLGPVDSFLIVYGDGSARHMDLSDEGKPVARHAFPGPEAVSDLALSLERIGGMLNCDGTQTATDVPLHTLTMLKPGTEQRAHTFSWWLPESSNGVIELRIQAFLDETFGGD